MKLRLVSALVIAFALAFACPTMSSAFDLGRTYEVRFESFPFYEVRDTAEATPLKANPGTKFRFETDLDKDHYRVSIVETKEASIARAKAFAAIAALAVAPAGSVVPNKTMYKIAKSEFDSDYYKLMSGVSVGLLTLPFKLRTDDGTLGADSTIGPFIGWNQRWLFGVHSIIAVAGGVSMIATQDINSTSPDNKAGLTWAVGLTIPIEKGFQVGIFTGADHIGGQEGKAWGHDDEIWVSFGVGYAFLQ